MNVVCFFNINLFMSVCSYCYLFHNNCFYVTFLLQIFYDAVYFQLIKQSMYLILIWAHFRSTEESIYYIVTAITFESYNYAHCKVC